ncbi:MAG: glycosyltransferase, partial [Ferruginibacter sp.]
MQDAESNTNTAPWVSFCMSTYKRPEFLKIQVANLLQQTFENFEIIISDNDPEGSGKVILEMFNDKRISYQVNKENLGMVKSFNYSLSRARGEFVVMITDDDPVYTDMLETLHTLYLKYPGYGVYHGGCEILCYSPFTASVLRAKVGINSCLSSELNYNEERVYSGKEFPYIFFQNKFGSLLLWSCGIVKREILVDTGGMPDYGTEFMTDQAYTIVNCSYAGVVYVNRALGHQAIHGDNFGFSNLGNFEKYKSLPDNFTKWVESRMEKRPDWPQLKKVMYPYL